MKRKKVNTTAWLRVYPMGSHSCLLYDNDGAKEERAQDKCRQRRTGEKPYGVLVKVRITEAA